MPARSRSWVRRTLARFVLVLVIALVVTACGGGGSKTKASTTGNPTTTTTTTPVQDIAADRAAAQRAIVRLADLPAGWQGTPHETSAENPDLNADLAACMNVDPKLLSTPENPTSVDSPDFASPTGASVSNNVSFTVSVDKAREAIGIFGKTELPGCLSAVITKQITAQAPNGMTFGTIDTKRMTMHSDAEETTAARLVIPIEIQGYSAVQYLDMVVFRVGRAIATITFSNTDAAPNTTSEVQLVNVVVKRLPTSSPQLAAPPSTSTTVMSSGSMTVTSILLSTGDESTAQSIASLPEGRRWAAGNANGTDEVQGAPHLVGYLVALNDGTTQHSIEVIDGKAVPYSGRYGPPEVTGPMHAVVIEATSDQQRAYVRAAQVVAPTATAGGIEAYVFYFPKLADGRYPMVAVYADQRVGRYAQGGPESR